MEPGSQILAGKRVGTLGPRVVIQHQSFFVSCAHVVKESDGLVYHHNELIAEVYHIDQRLDFCLLKPTDPPYHPLVQTALPIEGETVYKLGEATGLTHGHICHVDGDKILIRSNSVFATAGDSGSPLYSSTGTVLGIIYGKVGSTYVALSIGCIYHRLLQYI